MTFYRKFLSALALSLAVAIFGSESSVQAMPMFARKYAVDCAMCHAAVPRLNYTGFKFKAAGYRMPWEISKDQAADLLHLENSTAFVAFINSSANVTSNQAPGPVAQFNAQEVDVHPMTGSWGANWSSGFEVDMLPSGSVSVNQAFLGFTSGDADSFWSAQAGVVPNFLGYGPLDRPLAISTPLILSTSAGNAVQNTLFDWVDPRAAGATGSYWLGDTFLSASFRNRLGVVPGGGLDAIGGSATDHLGDVILSATQFINHAGAGSAVSLAYYKGQTSLPLPDGTGGFYTNSYNHLVAAANYYLSDRWNLVAGGGWGMDQTENLVTGAQNMGLYHAGYFGGFEYFWSPAMAAGVRYDGYRSDLNTDGTDIKEATLYYHFRPINQLVFSGEYQLQRFGAAAIANPGLVQSVLTLQALVAF